MNFDVFITPLKLGDITDPATDGITLHSLSEAEVGTIFDIVQDHSVLKTYLIPVDPVEEELDAK